MEVKTTDPQQLIACLDRLMATTSGSDEIMKTAANCADMLAVIPTSEVCIEKAQLLLAKHKAKYP